MRVRLAVKSLVRRRARSLLAVAGVAVSGALLLDMVMLSGGMHDSFRRLLLVQGFQLRIAPKGTLPFDSEATIGDAARLLQTLRSIPDVVAVSPVLGLQIHVIGGGRREATSFAIGLDESVQGDYTRVSGARSAAPDRIVVNAPFLDATGAKIGDTLDVAAGFDTQLRTYSGRRRLVIAGIGRFHYTSANQPVAAVPLPVLQAMGGPATADRVSLVMARVRNGADPEPARRAIEAAVPRVTAISTNSALRQVDERMGYFRQLAFILGSISLGVGFLLVTTLVTVSVNERIGEIAVLRAIGVSRWNVVKQIVLEGLAMSIAGSILGLALGLVTAGLLNDILSAFPGLPAAFKFFVFRAPAALTALGLLLTSGLLAGIYPAWRAASLPIADTLHREAIA